MTLRAKIILALIAGLGIIVLAFAGIWIYRFVQNTSSEEPGQATSTPQGTQLPTSQTGNQKLPQPVEPIPQTTKRTLSPAETEVVGFVLPFVERFGSYTNQGRYENLQDLLPLMAPSMKQWAQGKIQEVQNKPIPKVYQGTTTQALSYTTVSFGESQAEFVVSTQRKDLVGTTTNARVYMQDITIKLAKINGVWLVERAEWKN
jgi:hypothetical protein